MDAAAVRPHQPQDGPHQRRLAGAIRSQHTHELAGADLEADPVQDRAAAERQADVAEPDRAHDHYLARARSTASSSPSTHALYLFPAGSVSVAPTMGTCDARASLSMRAATASEAWLL